MQLQLKAMEGKIQPTFFPELIWKTEGRDL